MEQVTLKRATSKTIKEAEQKRIREEEGQRQPGIWLARINKGEQEPEGPVGAPAIYAWSGKGRTAATLAKSEPQGANARRRSDDVRRRGWCGASGAAAAIKVDDGLRAALADELRRSLLVSSSVAVAVALPGRAANGNAAVALAAGMAAQAGAEAADGDAEADVAETDVAALAALATGAALSGIVAVGSAKGDDGVCASKSASSVVSSQDSSLVSSSFTTVVVACTLSAERKAGAPARRRISRLEVILAVDAVDGGGAEKCVREK